MRKTFLFLVVLLWPNYAHTQGTHIASYASDPATCDPAKGTLYYDTTNKVMKYCSATNTWSQLGSTGTSATYSGTLTADIGSFNSLGTNFTDVACAAQSVGNSNQDRFSCDGTNWPVVSMNANAAQKLGLSMGVNAQTVNYTAVQSDCGKLITMNGVSLTLTLPAAIINSACVFDIKNLAATSLTIGRNGLNVDGAASNPTALTQNQGYRITNDGAGYWTEALQPATGGYTNLFQNGANALDIRNGTTQQALNIYNSWTDASNNSFITAQFFSNVAYLQAKAIGSGTGSPFHIGTGTNDTLYFMSNNSDRWQISSSGHLLGQTDNTYDIGAAGATRPRTLYAGTSINTPLVVTTTNCASGASPAVCAAAAAGAVAVPTGTNPTLVINTTAVTANSRIFLGIDESLTISATTCNTTLSTLVQPVVTARTAGTSFTIQIGAVIATNPACVSYFIVN